MIVKSQFKIQFNEHLIMFALIDHNSMSLLRNVGCPPEQGRWKKRIRFVFHVNVHGRLLMKICKAFSFPSPKPEVYKHWQTTLFISVCLSGGSASVHAGIADPSLGADTPLRSACWEIRPTSGRYASYWNAYLFRIWSGANTTTPPS